MCDAELKIALNISYLFYDFFLVVEVDLDIACSMVVGFFVKFY
jgi:hypothetical protein